MSTSGGEGGGGGSSLNIASFVFDGMSSVYGDIPLNTAVAFNTVALLPDAAVGASTAVPQVTSTALGTIFTFFSSSIYNIDTTHDGYDYSVTITVADLTGTQVLVLVGAARASAGGPGDTVTVMSSDLTISSQVGTDLAYDDTTGIISTTAGGTYGCFINYSGNWD